MTDTELFANIWHSDEGYDGEGPGWYADLDQDITGALYGPFESERDAEISMRSVKATMEPRTNTIRIELDIDKDLFKNHDEAEIKQHLGEVAYLIAMQVLQRRN